MAKKGKHTAPAPEAQEGKSKSLLQRLRVLLIVAAAALAVASLTAMEDGVRFASLRRWLMYGESSSTQDFHVYASDSGNRYGQLGTGLLVASPNNIQFFRDSGSAAYEIPVKMKNPQMSVGQRQAAVCDVGGDSLYLLDPMGTRRKMSTERGLCYYSARLSGSDYLAVTEQKNGYKAAVSVYNASGEPVFHFDSYDNYISDAIVTSDSRSVVAVSLESQYGVFASKLLVYDLESAQLTGSRIIQDGLVMDFSCNNNRMICLCDKRFVIATLDGQMLLDRPYGNLYLHDYALDGDGFCALLLGRYQSGNICTLTTFDVDGAELARLELTEEVLDISAAGEYLAVLYDDALVIYTRDLQEHARLEDTQYAGQIQMRADGTVLMISGASAWRYLP
ncbi:MAG: hypothetical protein HFF62_11900 [Oscillospiraceae bacterium]|jgi:hypothetical protein|nr:hypothetical protein [Oscillospiraceae bacterium]